MRFTLSTVLAVAASTLVAAEHHVRISSSDACKVYENLDNGDYVYKNDGWGEASYFVSDLTED